MFLEWLVCNFVKSHACKNLKKWQGEMYGDTFMIDKGAVGR